MNCWIWRNCFSNFIFNEQPGHKSKIAWFFIIIIFINLKKWKFDELKESEVNYFNAIYSSKHLCFWAVGQRRELEMNLKKYK